MSVKNAKIYEPQSIPEVDLPNILNWESIIDAPRSLAELNIEDGERLALAPNMEDLGDLAFKDLVAELDIANEAITNAKIAVNAIQGAVIAAGAITETKISDGAISTPKIATGAITANKIQAGTITANEIAASTITGDKIQSNTITTNKLQAGEIIGFTITGGTIRTASGSTRVEMNGGSNTLDVYTSNNIRTSVGAGTFTFYNTSGNSVASIYGDSSDLGSRSLLITGSVSSSNIFIQSGSSGDIGLSVGGLKLTVGGSEILIQTDIFPVGSNRYLGDLGSEWEWIWTNGLVVQEHGIIVSEGNVDVNEGFVNFAQMSGSLAESLDFENGSMYYRTSDGVLRVRLNNAWRTVTTT